MTGYHIRNIPRGTFGEISKIVEELCELQDAEEQGAEVMILCELADIYGAMEGYISKHHPSLSMRDIVLMSAITRRAFEDGTRQARVPESD